jgi:hypothetical protein
MILTNAMREKEHKIITAMYRASYDEQNSLTQINNTLWADNYIVDENQSVKWNREQVSIHNETLLETRESASIVAREEKDKLFYSLFECIKEQYEDEKLTFRMFKALWEHGCNDEGDDSRYWNILDNLKYRLENFYELLELREDKGE